MAEPDKNTSATAAAPDTSDASEQKQESLQQPSDAVEMQKMDGEAGPATPAKDGGDAEDHQAPPQTASSSIKGKERQAQPGEQSGTQEAETEPRKDSLSITKTDEQSTSSPDGPVCLITLLLPTGARHPYKIDEKYLTKRNVDIPESNDAGQKDPFSLSVYKLKELILREWREEWEGKPASPSSIRLIHFGKLLDDKEQLKKYQFSAESPNVVHMSVRPAEMIEEDEAAKGKSGSSAGRGNDGSSNCCVIL